jgi:dethiobiotin synthetase
MPTRIEPRGLFVTGTDTGVGKTLIACALLRAFAGDGLRAVGMKPVAAGCERVSTRLVNADVAALVAASNVHAPDGAVNPYCFEPPIAPHIAADLARTSISVPAIRQAYAVLESMSDRVVVEGAGGLLVPLSREADFGDLVRALGIPVVLVVGVRLGCLNHAMLTAEAIRNRGLVLEGWVANVLEPDMACLEQNLDFLRQRLGAPALGTIPFGVTDPAKAASHLDLPLSRPGLA